MAIQSLYRRYRPRRFSEVKGQDHVVVALRNAVINSREGQGYLFSGPRGTGKTTSARILAKVLNCTNPHDGEPCCACDSCLAVEAGTSFDVHELDAASNNGVESMRDLIEKASLGTPGRHKVYILDEVHMLSKGAEAALLKTLEEPPPHVVFVLATTDPQKVSATIRSRVQHLEFHLLPIDELEKHVRWVAQDAGLTVSEAAIESVLAQGGGSARDTLSALELVAAGGGDVQQAVSYDEFIEAFINNDAGQALAALAFAVRQGRDPRTLAQELVRHLRDCFLSLMAPELVQLPEQRINQVSDQGLRLGAANIVRAMEKLGEILVEMRHAPDPRLLLDVALVQLTNVTGGKDVAALIARIERLEKALAGGTPTSSSSGSPTQPTERAPLGARSGRDNTQPITRPAAASPTPQDTLPPATPAAVAAPAQQAPTAAPTAEPLPTSAPAPATASGRDIAALVGASWQTDILPTLKPMARALFAAGRFVGESAGSLAFGLPNETHRTRCEQYRKDVEEAIAKIVGTAVSVTLVVDNAPPNDDGLAIVIPLRTTATQAPSSRFSPQAQSRQVEEEGEIDLNDLVDVPPESVLSPVDRLEQAFPGSKLIEENRN